MELLILLDSAFLFFKILLISYLDIKESICVSGNPFRSFRHYNYSNIHGNYIYFVFDYRIRKNSLYCYSSHYLLIVAKC